MITALPVIFNLDSAKFATDQKFIEAINYLVSTGAYAGDTFISLNPGLTFLKEQKFNECLEQHPEQRALSLVWRLHTICWAAHNCLNIPGDFVECGVERGVAASMLTRYLDFEHVDKTLYLYDSFAGIPQEYLQQNKDLHKINHKCWSAPGLYELIQERFARYANIKVIQGELPSILQDVCPEKISFIHMDLTNYESEKDTLEFLINRLSNNAIVIFEGFGFEHYQIYKIAELPFIKQRDVKILELPTNQGLMIV